MAGTDPLSSPPDIRIPGVSSGVCVTVLCFRIRRLNEEEQTVRLSPHDTLTERNAEAESKKYFVLLLSF